MKTSGKQRLSLSLALSATALTTAATLLAPTQASASGFYLNEDSVKASGRAASGEVADQGPESLWWNPASIGGMEGAAGAIGASAIVSSATMTNYGSTVSYYGPTGTPLAVGVPVGGVPATGDPIRNGVAPSGSIAIALNHRIAVGLAISAPFNFTTQYTPGSWERYDAERTALHTIDIQPSVAVVVIPGLSLGAGINIERATATLGNALPNIVPPIALGVTSPLALDGSQALTGTGWDVGWSVGGQFRYGPLSLGVSYKSSIKHTLNGSLTAVVPPITAIGFPGGGQTIPSASASFSTPWQLIFGTRYAVSNRLTLNGQITRFGWSKFNAIYLGDPINEAMPENYRNTWTYAFGADFKTSKDWTVRAGISRDLSPVQDYSRDARVPDGDRWIYAVGVSHDFSHALTVDLAAQYVVIDSGPINAVTSSAAGPYTQVTRLDGEISDARAIVLSAGARFRF